MTLEDHQRRHAVREAQSWVGTPYHPQGDIKGTGADCGMLLVRVFVDTGLCVPFDPRPYADDWYLHRAEERYLGLYIRPDEGSGRAAARRRDGFSLRPLLRSRGNRDAGEPADHRSCVPACILAVIEEEVARSPALCAAARHPRFFSLRAKKGA